MGFFNRKKEETNAVKECDYSLNFKFGEEVTYKEVEGFFMFDGTVFFKNKSTCVTINAGDEVSFADYYCNKNELTRSPATMKQLGTVTVIPLFYA